jgi:hypothetical protein
MSIFRYGIGKWHDMNRHLLTIVKNKRLLRQTMVGALMHLTLLGIWILVHAAIIFYGSSNIPLHSAYIGDEQSPVNGALHVLHDASVLALHNLETLYYGPLFAILAIPGVLVSALIFFVTNGSIDPAAYQAYLLYDWGGIIVWVRSIAVMFSYLGLVALYKILTTKTVNPSQSKKLALVGVLLLASNFYFFAYGGMFKHWIFIITPFLWQIYVLIIQSESKEYKARYNVYQAILGVFAFGVSHIAILSQALLAPFVLRSLQKKEAFVQMCTHYILPYTIGSLLIIWWHPFAFFRYFEMFSGGVAKVNSESFTLLGEVAPVNAFLYYAEVLLLNHVGLIIALLLLAAVAFKRLPYILKQLCVGVALVGTLYIILFSNFDIVVARYTLFTIVSIIIVTTVVMVHQWDTLHSYTKFLVGALLLFQFVYHGVSIIGWSNFLNQGPADRKAVAEILALAKETNKDIFIQGETLFGWPHSTSSLAAFAVRTKRTDSSLYKAYSASTPQKEEVLDVTYLGNETPPKGSIFITCIDPITLGILKPDYPEVRLYRFWSGNHTWNVQCTKQEY